jgi:hypothetical protein
MKERAVAPADQEAAAFMGKSRAGRLLYAGEKARRKPG